MADGGSSGTQQEKRLRRRAILHISQREVAFCHLFGGLMRSMNVTLPDEQVHIHLRLASVCRRSHDLSANQLDGNPLKMKGNVMKKMLMLFCAFPLVGHTAEDLSCVFQWEGHVCGLWWGKTNLSSSVKEAIRKDVQQVVDSVSRSDVMVHNYASGEHGFGTFTGWLEYTSDKPRPNGFTLNQFLAIGTTNVFFLGTNLCERYLTALSLTNQYGVSGLATSNFVGTLMTATTNNFSRNDLLGLSWSIKTGRAPTLDLVRGSLSAPLLLVLPEQLA